MHLLVQVSFYWLILLCGQEKRTSEREKQEEQEEGERLMSAEFVDAVMNKKEKSNAGEYRQRNEGRFSAVVVDLGDQVAGGHI